MIRKLKNIISEKRKTTKFINFYKQYIKEGDLCFDIGANIGERTEIFLALNAKVVAVEPVEESNKVLASKFGENNDTTILSLAIGATPAEKKIYISNYLEVCTLSELFIEKYKDQKEFDIKWDEVRTTEIKTLDQLIQDYGVPTFCKIDVEGYEKEVLEGLSQPIPFISFEYNAKLKNLALECIDILRKFDSISYNFSPYETMKYTLDSWKNETEFYTFIKDLPDNVKTGDIYVKYR